MAECENIALGLPSSIIDLVVPKIISKIRRRDFKDASQSIHHRHTLPSESY